MHPIFVQHLPRLPLPSQLSPSVLTPISAPLIYSWSAQNTAGDTKRKCTTGVLFIGQSVGNVIGPQLYTPAEAPAYSRGLRSNLALYVVIVVLVAITTIYLAALNRAHSRRRVALGKSAVILDSSLDSAEEVERRRVAQGNLQRAESTAVAEPDAQQTVASEHDTQEQQQRRVGDKAFENMTDLENEEFVFVY